MKPLSEVAPLLLVIQIQIQVPLSRMKYVIRRGSLAAYPSISVLFVSVSYIPMHNFFLKNALSRYKYLKNIK